MNIFVEFERNGIVIKFFTGHFFTVEKKNQSHAAAVKPCTTQFCNYFALYTYEIIHHVCVCITVQLQNRFHAASNWLLF